VLPAKKNLTLGDNRIKHCQTLMKAKKNFTEDNRILAAVRERQEKLDPSRQRNSTNQTPVSAKKNLGLQRKLSHLRARSASKKKI
jgi:hypothetical protein